MCVTWLGTRHHSDRQLATRRKLLVCAGHLPEDCARVHVLEPASYEGFGAASEPVGTLSRDDQSLLHTFTDCHLT